MPPPCWYFPVVSFLTWLFCGPLRGFFLGRLALFVDPWADPIGMGFMGVQTRESIAGSQWIWRGSHAIEQVPSLADDLMLTLYIHEFGWVLASSLPLISSGNAALVIDSFLISLLLSVFRTKDVAATPRMIPRIRAISLIVAGIPAFGVPLEMRSTKESDFVLCQLPFVILL